MRKPFCPTCGRRVRAVPTEMQRLQMHLEYPLRPPDPDVLQSEILAAEQIAWEFREARRRYERVSPQRSTVRNTNQ